MTASGRKGSKMGLKTLGLALVAALFLMGHATRNLSGAAAASNGLRRLRPAPLQAQADDVTDEGGSSLEPGDLAALESDADVAPGQTADLAALETEADVAPGQKADPAAGAQDSPAAEIEAEEPTTTATLSAQDIAEAQSGVSVINKAFKRADQMTEGVIGSLDTVKRETERLGNDEAELKKTEAEVRQAEQVQDASEKAVEALKQTERAALAKQTETTAPAGDAVEGKTEAAPPASNASGALLGSWSAVWVVSLTFLVLSGTGSMAKFSVLC